MRKEKIKSVDNNKEKYLTYRELTGLMRESLKNNDYNAMILLVYPMIEDRLVSFMHYMYIVDKLGKDKKIYFTKYAYKIPEFKNNCDLKNIGVKIKVLKLLVDKPNEKNIFLNDCYYIIDKRIGVDNFIRFLDDLYLWKETRNEIVHASFNKKLSDLNKEKEYVAIEGYRLAKLASDYTNKVKSNNSILSIRDMYKDKEFIR